MFAHAYGCLDFVTLQSCKNQAYINILYLHIPLYKLLNSSCFYCYKKKHRLLLTAILESVSLFKSVILRHTEDLYPILVGINSFTIDSFKDLNACSLISWSNKSKI